MALADGFPPASSPELARTLVRLGCPLDAVSDDGNFALLLAFDYPNPLMARVLLELGASLQPPGAAPYPWLASMPELCMHGPWEDSPQGPLLLRCLVATGADVNAAHDSWTPLKHLANAMAQEGFRIPTHLALLEVLLALGADAGGVDNSGRNALHVLLLPRTDIGPQVTSHMLGKRVGGIMDKGWG
jgi:hypothetical protein